MDKILSPDIRLISNRPTKSFYELEQTSNVSSNRNLMNYSNLNPNNQRKIKVGGFPHNQSMNWKHRTALVKPKDSLNLFGGGKNGYDSKENEQESNIEQVKRGILDFPAYDIFVKNKSLYQKINLDLSREIENKKNLESKLSKIPLNLNRYQVFIIFYKRNANF